MRYFSTHTLQELIFSANFRMLKALSFSAAYSIDNNSSKLLGLSLTSVLKKTAVFYLALDNLPVTDFSFDKPFFMQPKNGGKVCVSMGALVFKFKGYHSYAESVDQRTEMNVQLKAKVE